MIAQIRSPGSMISCLTSRSPMTLLFSNFWGGRGGGRVPPSHSPPPSV